MARVAFIMAGNLWCLALQAHHEGQAGEGDTIFVPWVCPKGKQRANRGGFSFCIPATFVNGWAWGAALFRDYSKLTKTKQATSGLCFDAEGTAFTLKYVNDLNREVFEHLVQNTDDLSSYSWRRAGPTVGSLMKLTPLELCSLGDWADRSQIPKEATMPMHYSAARYEHSLRTKHIIRLAMEKLLAYESWETIPEQSFAEALDYARQQVDKVLKQESRVIWAAPLTKDELQARFQLSEALKLKAAAKGGSPSQRWADGYASFPQWEGAECLHEERGAYLWGISNEVLPVREGIMPG